MSKLYIVVPAYNEEANIECLVAEWHDVAVLVSPRSRLLVVDDGSTDNTSAILERLQRTHAQLRRLKKSNGGHGKAIYAGYIEALRDEADYVFQIDADRQTSRKDFLKFWRSRKHFEASIGFRANRLDGAERKFVSKVLQILLFLIYGLRIPDSNTPFRLIRSDVLAEALALIPGGSSLTNVLLTVALAAKGHAISWLPIEFRPRQAGVNSLNLRRIAGIGFGALQDFITFRRVLRQRGWLR